MYRSGFNESLLFGALTINDYKFRGRAWEIDTQSVYDILSDKLINVQLRDNEVLRVLPYKGGSWISDFTRFYYPLYKFDDLRKTVIYEQTLGAWWLVSSSIDQLFRKFGGICKVQACLHHVEAVFTVGIYEELTIQIGKFIPIGIPSYVLWTDNIIRLCGVGFGSICYNPIYNELYRGDVCGGNVQTPNFQNGAKVFVQSSLMSLRERRVGVIERLIVGLNTNSYFEKDIESVAGWQNCVVVGVETLNAVTKVVGRGVDDRFLKPSMGLLSGISQLSAAVYRDVVERLSLVLYENGSQPLQLYDDIGCRNGVIGLFRGEFLERKEYFWNDQFEGVGQDCIIQKPYECSPPSTVGVGVLERLKVGNIIF